VKLADEFASNSPRGIGRFLDGFEVRHVNGKQQSSDRAELIKSFAESAKGIITNARCLTEGVDIPAVDMVAFIDPRQSRVDIAQAVGRAMRKPRGETKKTVGYVFVPLFLGIKGESIDDAIKSERFDAVADVLNALQEHDEELVDLIREARQARGEGKPFKPRVLSDKVMMIGPRVELSRVVESVETKLVDTLGSSWDEWFGRLLQYSKLNGDCLVPVAYEDQYGNKLGRWVVKQRSGEKNKTETQREKLNKIGFIWDPFEGQWEQGFIALTMYKAEYGDCLVQRSFKNSYGYALGSWIGKQRQNRSRLSEAQVKRLSDIGFVWNQLVEQWEAAFAALVRYQKEFSSVMVPRPYVTPDGITLGSWVTVQRARRERLTSEQIERLNSIGFIWDPYEEMWELGFSELLRYVDQYGTTLVPRPYKSQDGFRLGEWVGRQRQFKQRGRLTVDQESRLDALGFVWRAR